MATAEESGDPGTWETARALGKQLIIPVGPYEPRVPTPDEMNAVLPYLLDRATTFYEPKYFCANAELALANLLGMNIPPQGFPKKNGFSRHGFDWDGFDRRGRNINGYDRDGFDERGFDKGGFDKTGFDRYGFDKDGYDRLRRDRDGRTRDEAAAALVAGWSDEFAALVAAQMGPPPGPAVKKAAPKKVKVAAKKVAPAAATAEPEKAPAKKAVAAKRAPAKKVRDLFAAA